MAERIGGETLVSIVEHAFKAAGLPWSLSEGRDVRNLQRQLEGRLSAFLDLTICSECGEIVEPGEPE